MLVDRVRETQLLHELVDGVGEVGAATVVSGPAGIGKSALLQVAVGHATGRGMRLLRATGVQSEAHLAFAGLHQLLRPLLDRVGDLPPRQAEALRAAFGMAESTAPEQFLISLAALELLSDTAVESPVLVVVEDAHWLDRASADVLAFVARRLGSEPVLLLAALREGYDTPLSGLAELRLGPLDTEASRELLDLRAPELTDLRRSQVLREAAGTPLALVELPRVAAQSGVSEVELPRVPAMTARLEQAYVSRLRDLPALTSRLLLIAAADDEDSVSEVLRAADVLLPGQGASISTLEPAAQAGLLALDPRRLEFRHPLVRSAIYQAASLQDRQDAHAALAQVLAQQPDRRAWHRAAATTHPDEDVAADVERTALRAQARGAGTAALTALARSATLTPDPVRKGDRLLRAGELAVTLGEPAQARRLLSEADSLLEDSIDRARMTLLRQAIDPGTPGDAFRVHALVTKAEELSSAGHDDLALGFLRAAAMLSWWADPGAVVRARVVSAALALPVSEADPQVLSILGFTDPGGHGGFVIEQARDLPPTTFDPETAQLLGSALNLAGAFDLSAAFVDHAVAGLREAGRLGMLPGVLTQQAWTAISMMNLAVAVPAADEAVRLGHETRQPLWVAAAQTGQAMIAGLRGDLGSTEQLLAQVSAIALPLGASAVLCGAQLARGVAAIGAGRYAEAFDQLLRLYDPSDPSYHHFQSSWGIGDLADAAAHSGQAESARRIVDRYESVAGSGPNPWLHVGLLYARPLLADDEHAEGLFREGLGAPVLARWPLYRARMLLEYGTWLRRRRRVAESRGPLRAALDALDALGVVAWAERARQELRASGEVSRPRTLDSWSGLSPQELQIAQMAACGLSNREIGQRLFLSHRTVGSHLYRIFPKLGITARAQLNTAIRGWGIDPSVDLRAVDGRAASE